MLIFGVLLSLVIWGHGQKVEVSRDRDWYERMARAGQAGAGANLDAPADPARPYPARPEWYFLFLFQLLKYFEGEKEIIGTVVIPTGVGLLLALLPLLGFGRMRRFGHAIGIVVIVLLLAGAGFLTVQAIAKDRGDEDLNKEQKKADMFAGRAIELAGAGIPAEGPVDLLRHDPLTAGPKLFQDNCAGCHNYGTEFHGDQAKASDLADFGTKKWVLGLLQDPKSDGYFGHTRLTAMSNWVKRTRDSARKKKQEAELDADFEQIAQWLGNHPRHPVPAESDQSSFAKGYRAFENRCSECHTYIGSGGTSTTHGPDLTGYGDADWLRLMIMAPASPLRYGANNSMPVFRDLDGPTAELSRLEANQAKELLLKSVPDDDPQAAKKRQQIEEAVNMANLGPMDRELIIRWLVKDYRVVFKGE
jgi:ubiquinol-cytochrome c reductase cytochrome b subunit